MVFFIALAFQASAADYWLKRSLGTDVAAFKGYTNWVNIATFEDAPEGGITSEDVCYIVSNKNITANNSTLSFPGKELHLGTEDGKLQGNFLLHTGFTCSDMRWHYGAIYLRSGAMSPTLSGQITLDCPGKDHVVRFTTAAPGATAHWSECIAAALVCTDQDVVVDVMLHNDAARDCYSTKSKAPLDAQIAFSGNNSGFKGKIKVSKFGHFALAHANAAGDPNTTRTDAIELDANSRLTVANSITPNVARGITITGVDAQVHARTYGSGLTDCNTFVLPMPITGEYGLTKMGDGTVTLSGAYTASDLVVSNGTLVLAETASFPRGQKVTVCAGATLVQNVYIPEIDVDCKEGGTYTRGYSYPVPYNPDTGSTPLDFTGGIPAEYEVLPIALSAAIKLPFHSTNRIDMAMLPSDTTATAEDFVDKTPKTYGLPKTSFEIENRDGTNYLVLVATPVVVSVKNLVFNDNPNPGFGGSGNIWSDGEIARPGFDYLFTNKVDGLQTRFYGDSLTIPKLPGATISLRNQISYMGKATIYPGNIIYPNNGSHPNFYFSSSDSLYLPDDGSGAETVFETRWASGTGKEMYVHVNIPLSGDGGVLLRGKNQNARNIDLSGNNSGYTGTIRCSSYENYSATDYALIHVYSPESLGGSPASFVYDSIQLLTYAHIVAESSFTLNTANRGIYVTAGGFTVKDGDTLSVKLPLRVNGELYKDGAGTLALGGAVSFGADGATVGSKNAFFVREGKVKVLSDAAVAGFATTFSDGTGIVLDATAGTVNGFTGTVAFGDGATVYVTAEGLDRNEPSTTLPICTVSGDSLEFTLGRVRGFKGEIVKENVTLDETSCTRYSVRYERQGMMLIFR